MKIQESNFGFISCTYYWNGPTGKYKWISVRTTFTTEWEIVQDTDGIAHHQ